MKTNAAIATTVGVIGVLALGACSTGASDQATESDSQSSAQSTSSPTDREAAKANNDNHVTALALKAGPFKDVVVTQNPGVSCKRSEQDGVLSKLIVKCTNVNSNWIGDAVAVRVPNEHFEIDIYNESWAKKRVGLFTTHRDVLGMSVKSIYADDKAAWGPDGVGTAELGWGAGIESGNRTENIDVTVTIVKVPW